MKTLDAIYKEYVKERTPEIEDALCCRLEKLGGIVLSQFRVRRRDDRYEEYLQTAYLLFFELLDTYDPDRGRLEGYYMVRFKFKLIDMLKARAMERREFRRLLGEDTLDESTPYNHTLVSDLLDKLYEDLTKTERVVATYMLMGVHPDEIAEMEQVPKQEVDYTLNDVRRKAEDLFFEDGDQIL